MNAITVRPKTPGSVRLEQWPEPATDDGDVLVETIAVGICGTDREIIDGAYGEAPPGRDRLVLGHESLGRVVHAPHGADVSAGDLVVAFVRWPDPVPCENCAAGEWDMCRNGQYTEHGIKGRDGFCRDRFRVPASRLLRLPPSLGLHGVLLEPTSIVAKAWVQIERIAGRSQSRPHRVLVLGAGPVGLLAALLGVQRGFEVHVLDRVAAGAKPDLVKRLGATYHTGPVADACRDIDVTIECTGAAALLIDAIRCVRADGIVCLTGVAASHQPVAIDPAAFNNALVLENHVILGTVNANRRHYAEAGAALAKADPEWLDAMITRRFPLARWAEAYRPAPGDVKTVMLFQES
jgi:2-desacetyl-2-hydroxyethyl bacteriochlorophyllide A dehydrogenase